MAVNIDIMKEVIKELNGEEYIDYNIKIKDCWKDEDLVCVTLEKNGSKKYFYYNKKLGRPVCNIVDGTYFYVKDDDNLDDYSFILSFYDNGAVRPFIGVTNLFLGRVYPYGYDVMKRAIVKFPINEYGLIDEKELLEDIKNEEENVFGYDIGKFIEALETSEISYTFRKLDEDHDFVDWVLRVLHDYNIDTIIKYSNKIDEILEERNKERRK